LFIGISFLFSELLSVEDVKIRRHKSAQKRELVDKIGVLSFDDDRSELTFHSGAGDDSPFHIPTCKMVLSSGSAHIPPGAKPWRLAR